MAIGDNEAYNDSRVCELCLHGVLPLLQPGNQQCVVRRIQNLVQRRLGGPPRRCMERKDAAKDTKSNRLAIAYYCGQCPGGMCHVAGIWMSEKD